ncbi:MAG: amino acid ABC transporter substrate-binding protein [Bacteroidetes bacterium]|nr:amino acid ABC transporter substrate-binding protein [Bacteroidota bacterium]
MTSARNPLPLSNGNRWLLLACIPLLAIAACSPKVRPVATVPVKTGQPEAKKQPEKVQPKAVENKVSSIAMLLPFDLDNLNPGNQYNVSDLTSAELSLDYYQGFKLALDSLTAKGYNFRLQLFDTKDQTAEAQHLAYQAPIRASDLVVGPVFPDDIQAFADILSGPPKPIVSPLSPASPARVKNANLITVATPLEYHARSVAGFINQHYKTNKVFILRSGFSDENRYISPFTKGIDSLSKNKIRVISTVIQHGNLDGLIQQLSKSQENIFVVPATDEAFLMVTLRSLDSLSKKYPVTVFGHPNWLKFTYLKQDLLQDIKAHVTSTDRVDYKSSAITEFIRLYRKAYHLEPTHYAMMGFDEGMYFGELLGKGDNSINELDKSDFTGLLNRYHFVKKPGLGWINTHVNMLEYANFELKKAE